MTERRGRSAAALSGAVIGVGMGGKAADPGLDNALAPHLLLAGGILLSVAAETAGGAA